MPSFCASVTCFEYAAGSSLYCDKHASGTEALVFGLNGTKVTLSPSDPSLALTLNEYIRRNTNFKGTKLSCGQGGCGACTVVESRTEVGQDGKRSVVHRTVNSCLRPVASLNGAAITTVEGLGSQATGFHPVQQRLAAFNGTQCGYCSPGMVMAIYGNLKALGNKTDMAQLESIFDGNICRCTGYRPILDAAKSFAKDSNVTDHINATKIAAYDGSNDPDFPKFLGDHKQQHLKLSTTSPSGSPLSWVQPLTLDQVFKALHSSESARLVGANTSLGIYQSDKETNRDLVDVSRVSELLGTSSTASHLAIGGSTTLEDFVRFLNAQHAPAKGRNNFAQLATQVRQIANIHVRNVGTVAGNLVMAKTKGFLSDLATSLLAADAQVELALSPSSRRVVPLLAFLEEKWNRVEVLTRVLVPVFSEHEVLATYKCAVRPQNAHAYVNAGFKFSLSADGATIQTAICAYGGVQEPDVPTSHAVRAKNTEAALIGQPLTLATLQTALGVLEKEIVPHNCHQSQVFSSRLVASFFYKAFLVAIEEGAKRGGSALSAPLRSAAELSVRPVTHGRQSFDTISTHAPVHQPVAKIEGLQQCSGESRFVDDIPSIDGTLHAAFVHAPVGHANLRGIDSSAALALPGVHACVTAADISANKWELPGFCPPDEVLVKDKIMYYNQPVGLIVADNAELARKAAKLVKLDLEALPLHTTLEQSLADEKFSVFPSKMSIPATGDAKPLSTDNVKVVKGRVQMGTQKHFYMEPQTLYVIPDDDDRFIIHCSLQCPGPVQMTIAKALGIPFNKLNVTHRRSGGAFGGKALHPIPMLIAATRAAQQLKRPVRMTLTREEDMWMCGGREELLGEYQVAFDDNGKIHGLRQNGHISAGGSLGISGFVPFLHNRSLHEVYYIPDFATTTEALRSNLCPRTACRGPGEMTASVSMETMIEHVAHATGLAPETVRERNFYPDEMVDKRSPAGEELHNYTVNTMWATLKKKVDYERRKAEVAAFNQAHRWRKRGLSITPVGYSVAQGPKSASVTIYADGTVLITHTGTEMGQGLNTKAAQVAAHSLGVIFGKPLDVSSIRFNDSNTYSFSANDVTGGSTGSEGTCAAVGLACKQLVATLEGCKKQLEAEAESKKEDGKQEAQAFDWHKLVGAAHARNLGLTATARHGTTEAEKLNYHNYGLCCSEVEVDILTGETSILGSYIIYDCGQSLNPAIDIGQCEGAFIMGVGHLLREKETVEADTGRLISDNTWGYKVPLACDIPQQFHVDFLQNAAFDKGYLSSKASGEPPLVLATSVYTAVRQAIYSARRDAGNEEFFELPVPATPEVIQTACLVNTAQLVL